LIFSKTVRGVDIVQTKDKEWDSIPVPAYYISLFIAS